MPVRLVECRQAVSPSRLPGLDWAVNPYRGCSHACAYCYAQDVTRFETGRLWGDVVEAKTNIVSRLKNELSKGSEGVYGIGTVTDPYQPAEKEYELTRGCLSVLKRYGARISILTKSDLVLRDLDILSGWRGAEVGITVSTMDDRVCGVIEPGAPSAETRVGALRKLVGSGVDVYLMAAPIIPGVSDSGDSLGRLVEAARDAGVRRIMWDMYNPKPLADARLRASLGNLGVGPEVLRAEKVQQGVREVLSDQCGSYGIKLVDAF